MPYDVDNPPDKLRGLPEDKQRQWVHVYESCMKEHSDDIKCQKMAWGVTGGWKDDTSKKGFDWEDLVEVVNGPGEDDLDTIREIATKEIGLPIEVKTLTENSINALLGDWLTDVEDKAIPEWVEVSFKVRGEATRTMPKLIEKIMNHGSPGHSFSIIVDPDMSQKEGGNEHYGFDGDGSDRIEDIRVNGEKFESEH